MLDEHFYNLDVSANAKRRPGRFVRVIDHRGQAALEEFFNDAGKVVVGCDVEWRPVSGGECMDVGPLLDEEQSDRLVFVDEGDV
jgi:hypothetical protein